MHFTESKMFKINVCRPDHLFACTWIFAVLGYTFAFAVPSFAVLLWISVFAIMFWLGSLAAHLVPINVRPQVMARPGGLVFVVWILSGISLFYSFLVASYILNSGIGFLALAEIRQAALGGEPVIANGNLLITAVQMNFCLSLLGYIYEKSFSTEKPGGSKDAASRAHVRAARRFIIIAVASLVISLLDGSRSFLLMGAICVVIAQLIIGVYRVRVAVIFFLAFVTVFSVTFPIVRPEVESAFDGFRYTMVYFAGGVGSLDYALAGKIRVFWQDFESIANKLGGVLPFLGGYDLSSLRMDMVNIGNNLQTNVFTSLGVYNEYFGWFTVIFAFFAGLSLGWIGRIARLRPGYLFVYAFYAAATVLSLFHEYYLATSYLLLKVGVVMALLHVIDYTLQLVNGTFKAAIESPR